MVKQRQGKIVNITSVIGLRGNPGQANYSAAKAGLIGFTRTVAKEVAGRNIQVNAVAPGFIETAITAALSPARQEDLLRQIPAGRFGQPREIAALVAFLCSLRRLHHRPNHHRRRWHDGLTRQNNPTTIKTRATRPTLTPMTPKTG